MTQVFMKLGRCIETNRCCRRCGSAGTSWGSRNRRSLVKGAWWSRGLDDIDESLEYTHLIYIEVYIEVYIYIYRYYIYLSFTYSYVNVCIYNIYIYTVYIYIIKYLNVYVHMYVVQCTVIQCD